MGWRRAFVCFKLLLLLLLLLKLRLLKLLLLLMLCLLLLFLYAGLGYENLSLVLINTLDVIVCFHDLRRLISWRWRFHHENTLVYSWDRRPAGGGRGAGALEGGKTNAVRRCLLFTPFQWC
jgi:hypothetical protein